MEPVRAQPKTEGKEEAEEARQNAASVSSEDSLAVGREDSEDTAAEKSEMEDSRSQLKSVDLSPVQKELLFCGYRLWGVSGICQEVEERWW